MFIYIYIYIYIVCVCVNVCVCVCVCARACLPGMFICASGKKSWPSGVNIRHGSLTCQSSYRVKVLITPYLTANNNFTVKTTQEEIFRCIFKSIAYKCFLPPLNSELSSNEHCRMGAVELSYAATMSSALRRVVPL